MSWSEGTRRASRSRGGYGSSSCDVCSQQLPPLRTGESWIHCDGRSAAFVRQQYRAQIHHGRRQNSPCWNCGRELGCDRCAGLDVDRLCKICVCWATEAGLLAHGPITDNHAQRERRGGRSALPLSGYPPKWQDAYRRQPRPEQFVSADSVSEMQQKFGCAGAA